MTGVVLNALAVAHLAQHLQVEAGALLQSLGLHQLAHAHQFLQPVGQLHLDGFHGSQHLFSRRHVVAAGVHGEARDLLPDASGERIEQLQGLHLVVKQLDADGQFGVFGREHVDGVAPHAELAAREVLLVALVLHAYQLGNDVALAQLVAHPQRHDHLVVALGLANAVDGRHGSHDHHIAPLQQAFGATQAHLLDVLVDGAVLFDEQVALRYVGFGLVVVVVADEVFHRVPGEEFAEFAVQLRRQRLVGREHDGRPAQSGDHVGHGEGLARAGHTEQGLEHFAVFNAFHQLGNRRGLVTRGRERLIQLER